MTAPSVATATPPASPVLWALRTHGLRLSAAPHLVLAALAAYTDAAGRGAWPSAARLARELGLHPRTVEAAIVTLARAGLIRRGDQDRAGRIRGDRRPVVWDLTLTVPDPAPDVAPVEVVPAPPDVIPTPDPAPAPEPPPAAEPAPAGRTYRHVDHPPGNPNDVPCSGCRQERRDRETAGRTVPEVPHPLCPVHPGEYALRCRYCPRETTTADHLPAAARRALEENKARARAAAARIMAGPPLAAFDRARLVEPELVGAS